MGDAERIDAVLLRRSRPLWDLGVALGVVGFVTSFAMRGDLRLPWLIGLGTTGAALALMGREGTASRVSCSLRPDGIAIGKRLAFPRTTIRSAWIERNYQGRRVHVDRGFYSDLELEAADDSEAETILRRLGCDPSQTAVAFPSSSRLAALAGAIGGQLCAHVLVGHDGIFTASVLTLSIVSCAVWYFLFLVFGRHVTSIGSDGVLLSGLLRSRFVPFADLVSAAVVSPGKLVLQARRRGERRERPAEFVRWMRGPAADAAAELIQSAATASGGGSEALRRQLRREGEGRGEGAGAGERAGAGEGSDLRDVGRWLARLRALAVREPYRAAGFAGDSLWRVVDDPLATGVERIAAAVVLGTGATAAERARLRDAAARMASPRVRVAIERVADSATGAADSDADDELAATVKSLATRDSAV
ncbi:MAG TPA: hypothetical protein VK762_26765 [Polyangiaceae bacterium]|nr:hypothetical protein [Polyangiaceae bacterium]